MSEEIEKDFAERQVLGRCSIDARVSGIQITIEDYTVIADLYELINLPNPKSDELKMITDVIKDKFGMVLR